MRAVLVTIWLAACGGRPPAATPISNATPPPAAPKHELLASLERKGCYGTCPIYKISVFRDGLIEYSGERFVKTTGASQGHATADQLEQLERLFQRDGYLQLASSYEHEDVTDASYAYTSYAAPDGTTKTIKHYHGDQRAPDTLDDVEQGIDRILVIEHWIGTSAEREKLRP